MLPDTMMIGNYDTVDIKVHSIPPVFLSKVPLKKYIHNLIELPLPIGQVGVHWEKLSLNSNYEAPEILLYQDQKWLYTSKISDTISLLKGTYDMTLTTIPLLHYPKVNVSSQKLKPYTLPQPGYLNVTKSTAIHADLYYYDDKNILTQCYQFQPQKTIENLTLLPRKYKIIYRSHRSMTIHGTFEKSFEIKGGDFINIAL